MLDSLFCFVWNSNILQQSQILYKDVDNQQWCDVAQCETQQWVGATLQSAIVGHLATQKVALHLPCHEDTCEQSAKWHDDVCRGVVENLEERYVAQIQSKEVEIEMPQQSQQAESNRQS